MGYGRSAGPTKGHAVGTSRRRIGTKIAAITATGLLVAGLTACGSDDDSPSNDPTTPLDTTVNTTLDSMPIDTTVTT